MAWVGGDARDHPFSSRPHRTLVWLSLPVLVSLIAEPLTGLADTAFVARVGAAAVAALGVGTVVLSGTFWIFNFLGLGTQTEVARALGAGDATRAREVTGLALVLSGLFGVAICVIGLVAAGPTAAAMGAEGALRASAVQYLRIRLLAAPAVLITTAAFGALRGMQDMRTPLKIAVTLNALNIALDAVLILGIGPIPALGIAGAAWATAASQWIGGIGALLAVRARLGFPAELHGRDARLLLVVGRDLFLRTGLLTLFLLLATRKATRIGSDAGAAHQAVRQVWVFTALVLDAFAAAAQSLVGYFRGAERPDQMRRVAWVTCLWSFATGFGLGVTMWLTTGPVARLLVPESAWPLFGGAWAAAAVFQPLNALSFATDGLHWGTGDYRFLRNAMALATGAGALALLLLDGAQADALVGVWLITGLWITIRAVFGVARIWPGIGASPFHGSAPPAG